MGTYQDKLNSARLFIALIADTPGENRKVNVEKCLEKGANVNEKFVNNLSNTPLHLSVIKKDIETVKLLLERGAKINCKNIEGKTPLDIAKEYTDSGRSIIKMLETFNCEKERTVDEATKFAVADCDNPKLFYQKLLGSFAKKGNFYETKLAALLYIRSLIFEGDEFYMGLNLKGIGAFSDICVRFKNNDKETVYFIQPKHRNDIRKCILSNTMNLNKDFNIYPYFQSYLKIREKFYSKNKNDFMYQGNFENIDFTFMIYRYHCTDKSVADLVRTGEYDDVFQISNTDNDVDLLTKLMLVDEMKCLGKKLFRFIKMDKYDMMLNDWLIQKYHLVLARSVIDVSKVKNSAYREGIFRKDFFSNNDELLKVLRETIFNEMVNGTKPNKSDLELLGAAVTPLSISKIMQNIPICYDKQNNCLVLPKTVRKKFKDLLDLLPDIKIKYSSFEVSLEMAIKEKLGVLRFKLPTMFGNVDVAVNGRKGVTRLGYIAKRMKAIMSHFKDNIVIINDRLIGPNKLVEPGIMRLNGGLRSAVGNLLVPCEEDDYFKFNMNDEKLGNNAKILLTLLMKIIPDLDSYKLKLDIKGFPKYTLRATNSDTMLANDFINNVRVYINQQQGHVLDSKIIKMLENYCITSKCASEKTTSNAWYDAVYFNIISELQKWWVSKGNSHYWTNDRNVFNGVLKDILGKSLLNIVSNFYIKQIKNLNIEFDEKAVKSLCSQLKTNNTIITTEAVTLTEIKLTQFFKNNGRNAFVNINSSLLCQVRDKHVLIKEIKGTKLKTLIIIHEVDSKSNTDLLFNLMNESATKQLILVTTKNNFEKVQPRIINKNFTQIKDETTKLIDLVPMDQEKVLNSKLIFQGIEIKLRKLIHEKLKQKIGAHTLQKIIRNEKNEIGKMLSNVNYEVIKKYYTDRSLQIVKKPLEECLLQPIPTRFYTYNEIIAKNLRTDTLKPKTFEDINDPVLLVSAPGTGKSTFLTHMSKVTKKQNPCLWIERINLSNYAKEFQRWRESKLKVNRVEALKFVCKAAINKIKSKANDDQDFDKIHFDLEIVNNLLVLTNYEKVKDSSLLELELFIYCYNEGNTILLFDEFDEISPRYREEVTKLLQYLVIGNNTENHTKNLNNKQRIWITSRSYEIITIIRETGFGAAYDLLPLTIPELRDSMNKYFKVNLNLKDLTFEQFINVESFLKYMITKKNFIQSIALLQILYYTAAEHFQQQLGYVELTSDKKYFLERWKIINIHRIRIEDLLRLKNCRTWRYQLHKNRYEEPIELELTSFHTNLALEYFTNKIQDIRAQQVRNDVTQWKLETNTISYWKIYLRKKLQMIKLKQNNKTSCNNHVLNDDYKKEYKNILDKHKKLAFYATFINVIDEILTKCEIDEIREIIKVFEVDRETGLGVDYMINGIPKFMNIMFQEYLTAEHMWCLIKTTSIDNQPKIWKFIVKYKPQGVLEYLERKFEAKYEMKPFLLSDESKKVAMKEIVRGLKKTQNAIFKNDIISAITNDSVFMGLKYMTLILINAVVDLANGNSLNELLRFLSKSKTFTKRLVYMFGATNWSDLYKNILVSVIKLDPSLLIYIYSDIFKEPALLRTVFSLLPRIPKNLMSFCILDDRVRNRKFRIFSVIGYCRLSKRIKQRKCVGKLRCIQGHKRFMLVAVCKYLDSVKTEKTKWNKINECELKTTFEQNISSCIIGDNNIN